MKNRSFSGMMTVADDEKLLAEKRKSLLQNEPLHGSSVDLVRIPCEKLLLQKRMNSQHKRVQRFFVMFLQRLLYVSLKT